MNVFSTILTGQDLSEQTFIWLPAQPSRNMIIILFWDLQHTQETHPLGTSVFSSLRLIFDIFPFPFTETSVLSDVDYVLCLDSIGKTDNLFLHVLKPPKDGTLAFSLVEVCTVCCRYNPFSG